MLNAIQPAQWRTVTVRYPYEKRDAVGPVTLELRQGERLLLLGPSGSGKSTLLHTLTGLVPQTIPATVEGEITLFGEAASSRQAADWANRVAFLFQDADQTLCGFKVEDEIAFALENQALPPSEIEARVSTAMAQLSLSPAWRERRTTTLSGGEKQLVALAGALAQQPELLVADEPAANLSPAAAEALYRLMMEKDEHRNILIVDHRLDDLIDQVDRVAVLGAQGSVIAEGPPRTLFREHFKTLVELGIWVPLASELDAILACEGILLEPAPLRVAQALTQLDPPPRETRETAIRAINSFVTAHRAAPVSAPSAPRLVRLQNAACAPLFGPQILSNINLDLHEGEIIGIVGPNGSGKSTLGLSLSGQLRLKSGTREGPAGGVAFQRPDTQFIAGSVREELGDALRGQQNTSKEINRLLEYWNLTGLGHRHPLELSQGQKRRLALACLTAQPRFPFLILDEPTAGLDAAGSAKIAERIQIIAETGRTIALITHDMDFALKLCTRLVVVGEGTILADGVPEALLSEKNLLNRAGLKEPAIFPALRWLEQYGC